MLEEKLIKSLLYMSRPRREPFKRNSLEEFLRTHSTVQNARWRDSIGPVKSLNTSTVSTKEPLCIHTHDLISDEELEQMRLRRKYLWKGLDSTVTETCNHIWIQKVFDEECEKYGSAEKSNAQSTSQSVSVELKETPIQDVEENLDSSKTLTNEIPELQKKTDWPEKESRPFVMPAIPVMISKKASEKSKPVSEVEKQHRQLNCCGVGNTPVPRKSPRSSASEVDEHSDISQGKNRDKYLKGAITIKHDPKSADVRSTCSDESADNARRCTSGLGRIIRSKCNVL